MKKAKKMIMFGVDAALPDIVRKFCDEGALPNIAGLMENGVFSRVISTFPPLTAAAWGAIVSGSGPGTCGIPSLMVRDPGEELDTWHTSFDRRHMLAESLWETEGKVGRRAALINWPTTWPMKIDNGIQIAASLNPPFRYFYMPLWDVASSAVFSPEKQRCNQVVDRAVQVKPELASDWENLPTSNLPPLTFSAQVPPVFAQGITYQVLIIAGKDKYDTFVLCSQKDGNEEVIRLQVGQWSDWQTEIFISKEGEKKKGRFRMYAVELSEDAKEFKLFSSAINNAEDYCLPEGLTEKVEAAAGPYIEVDDPWAFMDGWVSLDDYMEQLQQLVDWWEKSIIYSIERGDIDSVYAWIGTIDHLQHVMYGAIDPKSSHYKEEDEEYWMSYLRKSYQQVDKAIGRILGKIDLEETLIVVVSDHGFSALESSPYLKLYLQKKGLISYDIDANSGTMTVDWSKTKCFPLEPCHAHIFINLKGRDPQGIVEPQDYEKVQQEIIDILYDWKDPSTGERVVDLALPKQIAGQVGVMNGPGIDRVGDVLFAVKPRYMDSPFVYQASVKYFDGTERLIPNPEEFEPAELGKNFTGVHVALPWEPEMHATLIMSGPGVPKIERKHPANIIDIAPTVARFIDIPCPADAEGNSLEDVMQVMEKK
ncbi:MAG: hypothetical protein HOC09_06925 [Deltaproteobacteria bacterium]|jgi:predicted AlkP superfamily phosphohydrolase/phosphomutase|nr:hypothetical protein [Deltaproteobacteria bacterium]